MTTTSTELILSCSSLLHRNGRVLCIDDQILYAIRATSRTLFLQINSLEHGGSDVLVQQKLVNSVREKKVETQSRSSKICVDGPSFAMSITMWIPTTERSVSAMSRNSILFKMKLTTACQEACQRKCNECLVIIPHDKESVNLYRI